MATTTKNKSERVREYLQKNPDAKNVEVANALGVTPGLVSQQKANMNQGGGGSNRSGSGRGRRGRRRGRPPANGTASTSSTQAQSNKEKQAPNLQQLRTLKGLVNEFGGIQEVREALDFLEEFQS